MRSQKYSSFGVGTWMAWEKRRNIHWISHLKTCKSFVSSRKNSGKVPQKVAWRCKNFGKYKGSYREGKFHLRNSALSFGFCYAHDFTMRTTPRKMLGDSGRYYVFSEDSVSLNIPTRFRECNDDISPQFSSHNSTIPWVKCAIDTRVHRNFLSVSLSYILSYPIHHIHAFFQRQSGGTTNSSCFAFSCHPAI